MFSTKNHGIQLAIIAAVISGVSIFINKFAVDTIGPPLLFTATKNSLVGLAIFFLLLTTGKLQKIKLLKRKDFLRLIAIAIIGGALPFYLFFTGLSQVSAANSSFIQKTLVFWVALLAIPLLKERFTKIQLLGVGALFLANFIIGGLTKFQFSLGEAMILSATFLWAIEYLIAKIVLKTVDPDLVIAARMILGSVILLAISFLTIPSSVTQIIHFSTSQWAWLILTALTLLAYVATWYRALKYAPAITVTAILVGSTLVTNLLSAIFITHVWTILMLIQTALIAIGISLFFIPIVQMPVLKTQRG